MVRANKAVTRVINYQEVIRSSIFDMLCHLHRELNAGVGAAGYTPGFGSKIESLAKDFLELQKVLLIAQVVFPSQKEHRDTCIWGSIGLRIDEHRSVLEVPCEGLEIGALGRWCGILRGWHRFVIVLCLRRLNGSLVCGHRNDRDYRPTWSWRGFSATFGARRRFLLEGSIAVRPT